MSDSSAYKGSVVWLDAGLAADSALLRKEQ